MPKLQSWEWDNSDVNGSQIKGQWGSHNAELLALIKWLVSVFMAALLSSSTRAVKSWYHRWPLTRVPWHQPSVSPGSGLAQLIIFPSKHFIGLIETFIRDNETPRSTWISPELRILKPFMVWVPSPKLVSVSVNMSAVSVSQVAALQRTN